MDERRPRTKKERRQRRKRLEQARLRTSMPRTNDSPPVDLDDPLDSKEQASEKRRGRKNASELTEADVQGLKYFDKLAPLLGRLHDVGCERDRAGNRELHFDQYCMLILLYLFNPIVTSLRGIQQASELKNVQRKLGCPRAALGSLSEAASVFDAQCLNSARTKNA